MDGFGKIPSEPADIRAAKDFEPTAAFQWAVLAAEAMSQGHSERAEELIELAYSASAFRASCPRYSGKPELQTLPTGALTEVGQVEIQLRQQRKGRPGDRGGACKVATEPRDPGLDIGRNRLHLLCPASA